MDNRNVHMREPNPEKVYHVKNEKYGIESGQYGSWEYQKDKKVFVARGAAVYVRKVFCEIETGKKILELYFYDSAGRELTVNMERKNLTETGILSLADYGVQVTKQDAKALIWTIQNQEPETEQCFFHKSLGFCEYNGKKVFLGKKAIGVESRYDGKLCIGQKGSFDKWLSMIKEEVIGHVPLEFILAVAGSAVLADYIKEDISLENVLVHCVGESSTGKTTAALLAVSAGASPSFEGDSLVFTFADTDNSLMHSICSGYPALIDEGSLCQRNLTNFLYSLAMGKEKKRMTKELELSDPSCFKTAILMTSEHSLLNLCDENSGLIVRNLEFQGVTWTKSADSSDKIKSVIQSNYGFLVPKIAKRLLRAQKASLLKVYRTWRERIISRAKKNGNYNPLTERASKQSALIILGAKLVSDALGVEMDMYGILGFIEEHSLVNDPTSVDIGVRAHEHLMQYVNHHYEHFILEDDGDGSGVHNGCMGRIKRMPRSIELPDGRSGGRMLLVSESDFVKILKEGGFPDKNVVLKRLKALGLLKSEKDRYISKIVIQDHMEVKGYNIIIPNVSGTSKENKTHHIKRAVIERKRKPDDGGEK